MKLKKSLACVIFFLLLIAAISYAHKNISLFGGNMGNIDFPHGKHEKVLKNCKLCHSLFPKKDGIIKKMIDEKKLGKKQVMNNLCRACHKKMKKQGEKTGPTSCKKCHKK